MRSSYSKFLLAFSCLVLSLSAPLPLLSMENKENEKAPTTVVPTLQKKKWKDELYEFPEIETGFKIKVFNTLFLNPDFKHGENQKALFECLEKTAFERLNLQALEKVKLFSTHSVLHVSRLDPEKEKKAQQFMAQYFLHNEMAKFQKVTLSTFAFTAGLTCKEGDEEFQKGYDLAKSFLLFSLEWSSELATKGRALLTLGILHNEWRPSTAANLKMTQYFFEKAEAYGNTLAIGKLADFYRAINNNSKTIDYLKKDSDNGDIPSTISLAFVYSKGEMGAQINYPLSLSYFLKAYQSKDIQNDKKRTCAYYIGLQYLFGLCDSSPNYEKALTFLKAADTNHWEIQYRLGCCYHKLERYNEAVMWFEKSLNQYRKENKT